MNKTSSAIFGNLLAIPLRNGLTRPKAVRGSGVKMVNMGEIFANSRIGDLSMDRVQLSDRELADFSLEPGDLLFARQSLVLSGAGKCCVFLGASEDVTFESHIIRARLNKSTADPLFYYYFFNSTAGRAAIESIVEQVAAAGIRGSDLARLKVLWQPLERQRAISAICDALDRKIELNLRMSGTLEAIARTIFKSCFVDPVADVQTESLPTGWSIGTLGDVCRRISMGPFGSDIKTENFVQTGVPVIRGGNLRDGFIDKGFVYITEAKADELRNANAYPDDIVITHRGTLGQIGIIPRCSRFPRYVVSQSQMVLSTNPDVATPRFIFEFLRSPNGQYELLSNTSQTGVPAIARPVTAAKAMRLILPPLNLQKRFQDLSQSLADKEVANEHENHTLSTLRDTVFPKLISGEIRIDTVKRMIEAHA